MLAITDLHVAIEDKPVLRGLDLAIGTGEVHAIMGPNGSGKSTLAHVLAGREGYQISAGEVLFEGADLLALAPEQRAHKGVFLGISRIHSSEVPFVLNLQTGSITTQFHVVFDDSFSTVASIERESNPPDHWADLCLENTLYIPTESSATPLHLQDD